MRYLPRPFLRIGPLAAAATLLLAAACTGSGQPAAQPTTPPAAASPAASGAVAASPAAQPAATAVVIPSPSAEAAAKPSATSFAVSGAPLKLGLAYNTTNIQHLAVQIARDLNLFQKYGLDVAFGEMESGVDMSKVLIAGQLDVINTSVTEVASAVGAGEAERLITDGYDVPTDGLFARSDITSAAQLKGKTVAISRFGSQSETTMRLLLQKMGLDDTKDVTIVQVGGESARIKAVLGGTVDAAPGETSQRRSYEKQGLKMLDTLADPNGPGGITHGMVTTAAQLKNNREALRRAVMATSEAVWILKNRPEQASPSVQKMINSTDAQEVADVIQQQGNLEKLPPLIDEAKVVYALKLIQSSDPTASKQAPSELFDNSIVQELIQAGFFAQLGR